MKNKKFNRERGKKIDATYLMLNHEITLENKICIKTSFYFKCR